MTRKSTMTWIEWCRKYCLPGCTDAEADALLWNCSAFPFSNSRRLLKAQIRECLALGGGTVDGAIGAALRMLNASMTELRQKEAMAEYHGA